MAELMSQSDRGAAIIAGSVMEQILEATIIARLRPLLPGQYRSLFGRMSPLSSFSAKIEVGFSIGLYSDGVYRNLDMIRGVRNEFAHSFEAMSFEHPEVKKQMDAAAPYRLLTGSRAAPRYEFLAAFALVGAILLGLQPRDIRLPSVLETHSETLQEMVDALKAVLATKRAGPPEGPSPEST